MQRTARTPGYYVGDLVGTGCGRVDPRTTFGVEDHRQPAYALGRMNTAMRIVADLD
ncbi:MAG: hypothetical protein WCA92_19650 [Terriglobales bacterium]